ncbi:MAG: FdhF/YdeP family oxidoreductase, partial [Comamonadaceae bacterium]
ERGLVSFANPQSPLEMLTPAQTAISTQYLQLRIGGDIAAITGMCKALLDLDDEAQRNGQPRPIDAGFIAQHTHGFDAFTTFVRATPWAAIEAESGLTQAELEEAATTFSRAKAVIGIYGMGLTQHRKGVMNVQMVSNLLLMGGHIGRTGAGICPVRGHSNVQGQRTVGISEKPELVPLDRLAELYRFEPPREKGLNTVETCEGVIDGSVRGFIGLGGNFVRAVPDTERIEAAWRKLRLTVNVATKLNRSHLIHGEVSYLLPCLGRIEIDVQASGPQTVSVEDSTGCMHASVGVADPAVPMMLSEPAIVAGIAMATLEPNPNVPWKEWVGDYARVRDAIEATWPEVFKDFNARFRVPGGFHRPIPARERVWKTPNGKANFMVPEGLDANPDAPSNGVGVLQLMTMRSDDQFNTTVYSLDDRFRGVYGTRMVLLMNRGDMAALGLAEGQLVTASTAVADGHARRVAGLRVTPYDIPRGCVAGYYPECNPLMPLAHHAEESHVPAAKSIPIRLQPEGGFVAPRAARRARAAIASNAAG